MEIKLSNKNILLGVLIGAAIPVVLVLVIYAGAYLVNSVEEYRESVKKDVVTTPDRPTPTTPSEPEVTEPEYEQPVEEDEEETIQDDLEVEYLSVNWNDPVEIDPIDLFNETMWGYHKDYDTAYKVGVVSSGQNKGAEVILMSVVPDGPAFQNNYYRILKHGSLITFLIRASDEIWQDNFANYGFDLEKFSVNRTYTFKELENIPEKIILNNQRQVLKLAHVNQIFDNKYLKFVANSVVGPIYTHQDSFPEDKTSFEDAFYAKAADGTMIRYKYEPDFWSKETYGTYSYNIIPQITFNDGTVNETRYYDYDQGGCGPLNAISVVRDQSINFNTLEIIGRSSKGDDIYQLKDKESELLKGYYDRYIEISSYGDREVYSYEEFVEQRPVLFYVDPFDRLIKLESSLFIPAVECGKPVIYLYPEEEMEISVKVYPTGGFSYTEPEYNGEWLVKSTPNSEITDLRTGITWPYLFWEGNADSYFSADKGWVVKQENVKDFVTDSLTKLGLNKKEISDFNEFWLPKMKEKPYYFISFYGTSVMDKIAPLEINPQPDTVIRVLMDYTPLDKPIKVKPYELRSIPRKGFTVIEWGGVLR